ncbi:DUF6924 domain-containing protein [Paenarthrobacter nicotinovorans]|uniref:DUF6924 domain-containing protein n=1 Tax=Paenarthrobacter nicotinovorans TaxID=29320 RepID=UPI0004788F13|nr:hypothetical protein [Paenarthrobacter nicotinovorans]
MSTLPSTWDSLLVRTNFTDAQTWSEALAVVRTENADGFRAYVEVVDDRAWGNVGWQSLCNAVLGNAQHAAILFIVDGVALGPDLPVLVVDPSEPSNQPFRCAASSLWSVDNNLNIANMDWDEFAENTDIHGVFRGFE